MITMILIKVTIIIGNGKITIVGIIGLIMVILNLKFTKVMEIMQNINIPHIQWDVEHAAYIIMADVLVITDIKNMIIIEIIKMI